MTTRETRRRFLQTSAVAGGIALAGCLGGDDDENGAENGDENGDENGEENGEEAAAFASASPVCHDYTHDGEAYVTLGPSYADGGLIVFDPESFEITEEFPDIPANCGTLAHPTEEKFYVNAGSADTEEADGAGDWWVFDTESHEMIGDTRSTEGYDAHGVMFTPDNEELWMVNRDTDDGVIIDPETDEVIEEIDEVGESPDILAASPDGEFMFASTRGPEEYSGPHAIAGTEPGVAVIDVESRELVEVVEPDQDYTEEEIEDSDSPTPDFHAINVVPGESEDEYEVWAIDQGRANMYVLEPSGDSIEVTEEVNLGEGTEEVPHMVEYDSEYRYAAIASTGGAKTQIVRVDDYEIVEELDTGAGSHFAGWNPGDETLLVDVIGDTKFVEIEADIEEEEFEIGQELVLSELDQFPN
ncbi:hypothetical protein [Natranaeroarchaeum sulfidigenes]|uniref:Beta-propeller repeat containing protein n=1 Tax=Natranaeroarchaeum sulfidigenes TaxID=2784880 RepID=A0A897MQ61_9EURY|nr:hypothetical protein [Natranaeroarchaeum sulfidigenes]QSG02687.1 Beta-propeller repeat containing protein [Natranaeroarchaeum sulfidigenes]